jgi:DNA-binding PadR family transcriptional regulator
MDVRSLLEAIGVSLMARDVQVLGALLKLQSERLIATTVEQIREEVNLESDTKFSKTWIYKCLSNLEEEGFITVNRIDTPNTYSTGLESIGKALKQHIDQKKIELREEKKMLEEKIRYLREQSSDYLSEILIESMTGVQVETTARVVEGLQNVRNVVITEMTENVSHGDILRITDRGSLLEFDGAQSGAVERKIIEAMENGLEIRAIFREELFTSNQDSGQIRPYLVNARENLVKCIINGRLKIRLAKDPSSSYRMFCYNKEKMLLFLVEDTKPDSVAFVTYEANPILIEDAVDSFDRRWESAYDITDGFAEMFNQMRE